MLLNQYKPPKSNVSVMNRSGPGGVTTAMLDAMRGSKPWVLLNGIVLFVSEEFMLLGTLGMMVWSRSSYTEIKMPA
jgi:hypothetical protein